MTFTRNSAYQNSLWKHGKPGLDFLRLESWSPDFWRSFSKCCLCLEPQNLNLGLDLECFGFGTILTFNLNSLSHGSLSTGLRNEPLNEGMVFTVSLLAEALALSNHRNSNANL